MNLFYQPLIDEVHNLDAGESRHSVRVLRKKSGDVIHITDGKGSLYEARIVQSDAEKSTFEILSKKSETKPSFSIHIAISPLKLADRLEWFIEKSIELGIHRITLIDCERTEKTHFKTERLKKIAIAAMKQSLRFTLPPIEGPIPFDAFIANSTAREKFLAHADPANRQHLFKLAKPESEYVVLIGPEGDFSINEIDLAIKQHFTKVSLGDNRLRTETAGMAACHILNLVNVR